MKREFPLCMMAVAVLLILTVTQLAAVPLSTIQRTHQTDASVYKLTFINVGQGDAALLQDPTGFTVIIDGGKSASGPELVRFIREQQIRQIDVMVASHPDRDHVSGLIDVLQMNDVPVKSVVYNGYPGITQTWADFAAAVQQEGLTFTVIDFPRTFYWGMFTVMAANPEAALTNPDSNDACLALMVGTGSLKTFFACDLNSGQESIILSRSIDVDADILKVAHHGSREGTSQAFVDASTPKEAILSVGVNDYGHPDPAVTARLEAAGARVWRMDVTGNITIYTDGSDYSVNRPLATLGLSLYLPIILRPFEVVATPVVPTASPTSQPPAGSTKVVVTFIFVDGAGSAEPDEYVEIKNTDSAAIQLERWTLSDNQNHVFTFPNFQMQPGATCRVYTNQDHPESCGFNYNSSSAIWNNGGDCAFLKDAGGNIVSQMCY